MDVWRDPWADEETANKDEKKDQDEQEPKDEQDWEPKSSALSPGYSTWRGLDLPTSPGWSRVTGSNGLGWSAPPSPGLVSENKAADDIEVAENREDNEDLEQSEDARGVELHETSHGGSSESANDPTTIFQDLNFETLANREAIRDGSFQHPESEVSSNTDQTSESAHSIESHGALHQGLTSAAPVVDGWETPSGHRLSQHNKHDTNAYNPEQEDVRQPRVDSPRRSRPPARQVDEAERKLLDVIFPRLTKELSENAGRPREEPEELIGPSSTRRIWYRISRPDPMREVERGETNENYVRVAWPTSKIRDKTLQITERWAAEQRLRGRLFVDGPAAAPFSWSDNSAGTDTAIPAPASKPTQPPTAQARKVSAAQVPKAETKSPFASPAMVQFSWSTQPAEPPVANPSALFSPTTAVVEERGTSGRELIESPKIRSDLHDSAANGIDHEASKVKKWEVQLPPVSLSKPLSPTTINKRALSDARQYQEATASLDATLAPDDKSVVPPHSTSTITSAEPPAAQIQSPAIGKPQQTDEPDWGDFFSMQEAKVVPHGHSSAMPVLHNTGSMLSEAALAPGAVDDDDDEFEWGEIAQPTANATSMTEASDFVWAEPQFGAPSSKPVFDNGFTWNGNVGQLQASQLPIPSSSADRTSHAEPSVVRDEGTKMPSLDAFSEMMATPPQPDASLSSTASPTKATMMMPPVPRRRSSLEWMKATSVTKPITNDDKASGLADSAIKDLLDRLPNFEYMLN